jgi:anaerobic ribonucleoside-triphosphate reductase
VKEKKDTSKLKIPCEVFSRIVGYYMPIETWNPGKVQEFAERKVYKVNDGEDRDGQAREPKA